MKSSAFVAAMMFVATLMGASAEAAPDYSDRDNVAPMSTAGALDSKRGISPDLFSRYWRDVHGVLASRIFGIYQYWQHHLDAPLRNFWPAIRGIKYDISATDAIEGLSELTFQSEKARAGLGTNTVAKQLAVDEQNIFEQTVLYNSRPGNTRTYIDRIENGAPQGDGELLKMIVFFKKAQNIQTEEFRRFLAEELARSFAASEHVLKVRLHLVEPYDPTLWDTPNVNNELPSDKQYQAWMEIVFQDEVTARQFIASRNYQDTVADQPKFIRAIHTYPVRATYTLVYEGRPTLVGLRGLPIVQTIREVGAANQTELGVLRSIYGPQTQAPDSRK